ncbi:CTD small phosphatase-like protein 2 isoform X2 [Asparagus officinalis]|nr:CTD small phosphatase-like protein 2 isoform X2 [Asparagus officinalis]
METIFSPVFDQNDSQFRPINHNDAVRDDSLELPQLVSVDSINGRFTFGDAQNCTVWDLYNSEVAASPLVGDIGYPDVITAGFQDYEHIQYEMIFDHETKYMVLPSLEKPLEVSSIDDDKSTEAAMSSDDSCFYLAIHQMTSKLETEIGYRYSGTEEVECFDPQIFLRNLPDISEADWPNLLQKETTKRKPITLVLDLDETLVHSTLEYCGDADFSFQVFFNMKQHTVYVKRRPHLQTFLERVSHMFEVVIFTASQSIYAEQLLDILDPNRNLFSKRMYRESCIFSDGNYTKDLTVLGVDLAKVLIVDNSPQVFRLQVNNGIPITSWFDDPSDQALISLLPFLETLVDADDVRPIIAERFGNAE